MPEPRADLHQHDLTPAAATRLVDQAKVHEAEPVLEIGCGTGALTAALIAVGARVQGIELDRQRAAGLRQRFAEELADGRLTLMVGDARHHHPQLAPGYRIVANPPFKHSAELLRRWLLEDLPGGPPKRIDLLLQDQTARKLCGGTSGNSQLGVLAQAVGRLQLGGRFARDDVDPPSHVPLRHWTLIRHPGALDTAALRRLDRLLEQAFTGVHSVRQALRHCSTPAILKRQGEEFGWNPDDHPRHLGVQAWVSLATFLHRIGKL